MSGIVVLMYHALYADDRERAALDHDERPFAVHVEDFRRQIDVLRSRGLPLLAPQALADPGCIRGVVVTFDDGHASLARRAFPVLAEENVPALMLLTTGFIGCRRDFLEWPQVREMSRAGVRFGSHGHTHRFLDALGEGELREELRASREALSDALGHPPDSLSFPGGCYDSRVVHAAAEAGFTWLYSSDMRTVDVPRSPPCVIPRIAVRDGMPVERFAALATDPAALGRARIAECVKRGVRRIIGHDAYMYLYARVPR